MQASDEISPSADAPDTRLYVLRLWRETADGPWRAALRPAGGAPPRGFADLAQLAAYLLAFADDRPPTTDDR
jgi:hypothetical protein